MNTLRSKTTDQILIPQLEVAHTFWKRGKGLLGRTELIESQGLWIPRCNSIHTFFMKFPIDCVFLDRHFTVKAIYRDIPPGRLIFPVWGASSVVELAAGASQKINVQVGDKLYVGT